MRDPSGLRVIEALCPQVSRYAMATHELPDALQVVRHIEQRVGQAYWATRRIMENDFRLNSQLIEPLDLDLESIYWQTQAGVSRPEQFFVTSDVTMPSGQILLAGAYVLNQETNEYACYKLYSPECEAVVQRMKAMGLDPWWEP